MPTRDFGFKGKLAAVIGGAMPFGSLPRG